MNGQGDKLLTLPVKLLFLTTGGVSGGAALLLYVFPDRSADYFVWTVKNPLTLVLIGGCLASGLNLLWVVSENRWSVARVLAPSIVVYTLTQFLATVLDLPASIGRVRWLGHGWLSTLLAHVWQRCASS